MDAIALIPHMLAELMARDRGFQAARKRTIGNQVYRATHPGRASNQRSPLGLDGHGQEAL